jgi:hypothetical protein
LAEADIAHNVAHERTGLGKRIKRMLHRQMTPRHTNHSLDERLFEQAKALFWRSGLAQSFASSIAARPQRPRKLK